MKEITKSLSENQDESSFVKSGIFGRTAEECIQIMGKLNEFIEGLGWR